MDRPRRSSDNLLDKTENVFQPRARYHQRPQTGSGGRTGLQIANAQPRKTALALSSGNAPYRLAARLGQSRKRASIGKEQSDENIAKHHRAHDDSTHELRFACPFYKRNPNARHEARTCLYPSFRSIPRLKEHLYRRHMRPGSESTCPRCFATFETTENLEVHLKPVGRCIRVQTSAVRTDNMLDPGQVERLRQRPKITHGVSHEEEWRVVYRICHFLSDDSGTPSPYYDSPSAIPRSDIEVTGHIPLHFPGNPLAFLEMPRNFDENISSEINTPRVFPSGGDSWSTVDSGYGPSVYDPTDDAGYGPNLSGFAPPISSHEPNDSYSSLEHNRHFGFHENLPSDPLPENLNFDFFQELDLMVAQQESKPPHRSDDNGVVESESPENLNFVFFQELDLMVAQQKSKPPHRFDDNGVVESESRSGLAGTERAQLKGLVNPVEPQVHSEKRGARSASPPSGSMNTPATSPSSIDTNNSVQEIQDKTNYSRASIYPISTDSDTLCHDQTDKETATIKLQAYLGAPQDIPADLLHPNDGSISQSSLNHAKITANMAIKSHGAELKRFLISKLMKKANELLGYTASEVSSSCSMSDTSSDDTLSDEDLQSSRDISPVGDEVETETEVRLSPSDGSSESKKRHHDGGSIMTNSAGVSEGPPPRSGNKRRRVLDDDGEEDQDEENCEKRRKTSKPSRSLQRKRRFACPFYKQNPAAFARCTACVSHGFETIARTKEHIYRNHREGHVCEICHDTFESNRELLNHLMQPERCTAVNAPLQRVGINEDQKGKLGHRWRGMIDEEKWRKIYRICHNLNDDNPTPSPYWDDQDALASQAVERYDQFQRNHLPSRIQMLLEAEAETNPEFNRLYENLLSRLPDVIREAQRGLYEAYTTLQGFPTTQTPLRAQQNAPDNAATLGASLDVPSVLLSSGENAASPPVAFEAPPNTENGMTVNEAHEVHTQSNQQPNSNSDSGYGSILVDSQAELPRTNYIPEPSGSQSGAAPLRPFYPEEINSLDGTSLGEFQVDQSDQNDLFQMFDRFSPFLFDTDCIDPNSLSNTDDPSNSAPYDNPSGI